MEWTLRREEPGDYDEVEHLTRDAFWDVYKPGCDEHLVAHRLRTSPRFVPQLDLVALDGERIVGNIMYSRASIMDDSGGNTEELDIALVKSTLAKNGCIVPGVTEFDSFEHMMSIEYPPLSV